MHDCERSKANDANMCNSVGNCQMDCKYWIVRYSLNCDRILGKWRLVFSIELEPWNGASVGGRYVLIWKKLGWRLIYQIIQAFGRSICGAADF